MRPHEVIWLIASCKGKAGLTTSFPELQDSFLQPEKGVHSNVTYSLAEETWNWIKHVVPEEALDMVRQNTQELETASARQHRSLLAASGSVQGVLLPCTFQLHSCI